MRRAQVIVSLAAIVVCIGPRAHATPGRFQLTWSGGPGCPNQDELEIRVERILNRPVAVREGEQLLVEAAVEEPQPNTSWRVELAVDNGRRRTNRSLQAASCDELANATALVIAIILEPTFEQTAADTAPQSSSVQPKPAPPQQRAKTELDAAAQQEDDRADQVQLGIGAFGAAINALLPTWSGGFGLDTIVRWRALQAHISGAYFLPVEQQAPDTASQGARFRLIAAQMELGLRLPVLTDLSVAVCSGAQLAFLHGEGFGPGVTANTQDARFIAFSAGGLLAWEASEHWTVVFDADALFPLGDRRFVFSGTNPAAIHTPSWGAQLALGVQYHFGGADLPDAGPY